jgi:hypothetical protein
MAVVGRIVVMVLAYVLACATTSIVLAVGTFTLQWNDLSLPSPETFVLWTGIAVTAAFITIFAMLPTLLVLVLAEWLAWRSILIYAALGGMLALILVYGLDFAAYVGSVFVREREVVAAAGIAGGLVYWLFAGRGAGAWK